MSDLNDERESPMDPTELPVFTQRPGTKPRPESAPQSEPAGRPERPASTRAQTRRPGAHALAGPISTAVSTAAGAPFEPPAQPAATGASSLPAPVYTGPRTPAAGNPLLGRRGRGATGELPLHTGGDAGAPLPGEPATAAASDVRPGADSDTAPGVETRNAGEQLWRSVMPLPVSRQHQHEAYLPPPAPAPAERADPYDPGHYLDAEYSGAADAPASFVVPPASAGPADLPLNSRWLTAQASEPPYSQHPGGHPADHHGRGVRGREEPVAVNWFDVAKLRAQASEDLTRATAGEVGMDLETKRELGREIIQELIRTTAADRIHEGTPGWSAQEQNALAEAVFDAVFGLGRLQPLVDDDSVENIIISGADTVWLEKTDGTLVRSAPVANSDEELLDFLAFVASNSESNARSFSPANPRLHLRLDGGARLAAAAWVTARPSVVIRRHRLVRVTLDDLVTRRMLTRTQATFLRAAVRARKSIVVAGAQGAGKTTLVRALCAEIAGHEAIGTFETEFELHLHEMRDIHPIVHAWESRPGSGEIGADGRPAGEFTIDEALYDSFRFNLSRQIVGEVRGREIWAMIKAMESGAGSISTTHAADAEAAVRKLVTCAMEAGSHVTKDLATSKLAETVDLIVQVHLETVPAGSDSQYEASHRAPGHPAGESDSGPGTGRWRRSRWVSEIVHLTPGEAVKGYATTHVFTPNPAGGPGMPGTLPDDLRALERHGFDLNAYLAENGRPEGQL